ncbi:PAS domain-containing protein [Candidatus Peregrinibacteria bacterium]|nr:PAS domain-containing protein [Candidatus Peregrinibacteria bacterium]MBI3816449.1 PAS domain-containing protein [Candidatus Peregrinibacteria bacterium]
MLALPKESPSPGSSMRNPTRPNRVGADVRENADGRSSPELPQVHVSILHRIVLQSLLISGITIVLLSTLSFIIARALMTQQRVFDQLSAIATSKKGFLEREMQADRENVSLLARTISMAAVTRGSRVPAQLLQILQRKHIPVMGLALFDRNHHLLSAAGERVIAFFPGIADSQFVPLIDAKKGWKAVMVYAPIHDEHAEIVGFLGAAYDMNDVMHTLFDDLVPSLGKSASLTIGERQGGELFIVHSSRTEDLLHFYPVGSLDEERIANAPLTLAVRGREGVQATTDERGKSVLVAQRFLPSLNWGMVVSIESNDVFSRVEQYALALILISTLILSLSGLFGFFSARHLTRPLLNLAAKIRMLQPGNWTFRRTIRTGDEVELLDQVIADLTTRLHASYENLEAQVADRTRDLRKQYALDRAILESIAYGVFAVDPDGRITSANSAAHHLLGFTREEMIGKSAVDILPLHAQRLHVATPEHPVMRCLRMREIFRASPSMHVSVVRRNQTPLPVMLMVTPLVQDDQLLGAIVVFLDITEERQTDYMKSEFISLASHQLRTPLSTLRWYIELLGDSENLTNEQKEYMQELDHAARRMAILLDTLLRVTRLDDKGVIIERTAINIVETMQRIAEELKLAVKEMLVSLSVTLPERPITIATDPVLLSIVVQNLVSNAAKYSPKGATVELTMRDLPGEIEISVRDQGVGIPQPEQMRVFEKFFRAKNVRSLLAEGTGLGLYLCKRIMESLGGAIAFTSAEGKGTTFTIRVPKTGGEEGLNK